jgi:hypothetical protein
MTKFPFIEKNINVLLPFVNMENIQENINLSHFYSLCLAMIRPFLWALKSAS